MLKWHQLTDWNLVSRLTGTSLFLSAIHQWRHALLHLDQDEWQWKRRRERTNPHPWLPQDGSDAALYEPHRQHGTGRLRHVTTIKPCWQRWTGRRGAQDSDNLKNHGCLVWLIYSPGWQCTQLEKDLNLLPKCTIKPLLKNRDSIFFILTNGCLKRDLEKRKEGICVAINKPSMGSGFEIFYSVLSC